MLVNVLTNGNRILEIHHDESPCSPRDMENLGTMACVHKNYLLGDSNNLSVEAIKAIEADTSNYIALPLYLYDHSGLTMNTTGFSCRWDSGQVGLIFVAKETVRKEYGWKVITQKRKEEILTHLVNEVNTYDAYLCGEIYGFKLLENGEEIDSCWGFYGSDHRDSGLFDCAGWEYEPKTNKEKNLDLLK